jgi:hypothetical protein
MDYQILCERDGLIVEEEFASTKREAYVIAKRVAKAHGFAKIYEGENIGNNTWWEHLDTLGKEED